MSEMPHCAKGNRAATYCNSVKICYQKPDFWKQFFTPAALEVTEYKSPGRGWYGPGGIQRQTASKMQEIGLSCTVEEGPCIQ
jgi:hypothetical protein